MRPLPMPPTNGAINLRVWPFAAGRRAHVHGRDTSSFSASRAEPSGRIIPLSASEISRPGEIESRPAQLNSTQPNSSRLDPKRLGCHRLLPLPRFVKRRMQIGHRSRRRIGPRDQQVQAPAKSGEAIRRSQLFCSILSLLAAAKRTKRLDSTRLGWRRPSRAEPRRR